MNCFKLVSLALCAALLLPPAPARAALVGTEDAVAQSRAGAQVNSDTGGTARSRLSLFIDREEVRARMTAMGIDAEEAKARIAALSDREAADFAANFDNLPAGGDAVGAIVGTILLVFLILLLTDLLGLTHVYPFVTRR